MINFGGSNPILNDKLLFHYAMRSVSAPVPATYAIVDRGLRWIEPPADVDPSDGLPGLLTTGRELVLKPVDGGAGRGVAVVAVEDGALRINDRRSEPRDLDGVLAPGTLVQQRVRQGTYAATISPTSTNTLRVLTMWDYEREEPFIATAGHRFGTKASYPVDSYSRGGIIVDVDVAAGTLGRALSPPRSREREWHSTHPDTGAQITGVRLPHWQAATDELLRLASRLPRIRYVGWDLLVTDDGFFVIEGNSFPEVAGHQVFTPLLADPRVRRFYRTHGVISR